MRETKKEAESFSRSGTIPGRSTAHVGSGCVTSAGCFFF